MIQFAWAAADALVSVAAVLHENWLQASSAVAKRALRSKIDEAALINALKVALSCGCCSWRQLSLRRRQ